MPAASKTTVVVTIYDEKAASGDDYSRDTLVTDLAAKSKYHLVSKDKAIGIVKYSTSCISI